MYFPSAIAIAAFLFGDVLITKFSPQAKLIIHFALTTNLKMIMLLKPF